MSPASALCLLMAAVNIGVSFLGDFNTYSVINWIVAAFAAFVALVCWGD